MAAQPAPGGGRQVEVIPVQGVLMPRCEEIFERWGYMTSTERLAGRVESAAAAGVDEIVLVFDSPGGSVAGLPECCDTHRGCGREHSDPSHLGRLVHVC